MSDTQPRLQKAGSVNLRTLKLISANDLIVDLNDFLIELNVYEDIFSSHMYGDIALSDSRNLIDTLPIVGEEYLNIEFFTPTFEENKQTIKKTFRVYKLSNRKVVRDNNTQTFILHFASIELFNDILLPIFKGFEGKISDLAREIFFDYVAANRVFNINEDNTNIENENINTTLTIINETSNKVKFVSPGWSPFKCLNWLASKAMPAEGKSSNYLFFETNKGYYFGSIEALFKEATENKNIIGTYSFSPNNKKNGDNRDIVKEFFTISEFDVVDTTDQVKNYTNGYLANRLITLDVYNKIYKRIDYDHVEDYANHYHTSGKGEEAEPIFSKQPLRNFATNISYYPVNPKLFDNFPDNISEKMEFIYGNRKSNLIGLTNLKMNITVPGRTDVEAGSLLYLKFPGLGPSSEKDQTKDKSDKNFSGYYLVTAIHHRVTLEEHIMVMEIVKDSLRIET